MSKQISPAELAVIVTKLLTGNSGELDEMHKFASFMTDITQVVCDHCGGEVSSDANDDGDGEWLVGVRGNDSLPEDGGIWKDYDVEGELFPPATPVTTVVGRLWFALVEHEAVPGTRTVAFFQEKEPTDEQVIARFKKDETLGDDDIAQLQITAVMDLSHAAKTDADSATALKQFAEAQSASIIENGEQLDVTLAQAACLLAKGLIYDSGEGYYHLVDGHTLDEVGSTLKA